MFLEFIITSLIVILLPGTGVLYVMTIGLTKGLHASIAASLGCTFGIIPAASASILGLAAIFHASALAFQLVKFLGVAYLLYMAWMIWRDKSSFTIEAHHKTARPLSYFKIVSSGALLNILNPKLSLFFFAFLPQFMDITAIDASLQMIQLASIFMALTFCVFVLYGGCASILRDVILSRPKIMQGIQKAFAGCFAVIGIKLALSDNPA